MNESTPLAPPFMGPALPLWPPHHQFVRVTSPAIVGANVSHCRVQQFVPPLGLRDREEAYVLEPNGVPLGPAVYDARLVGSFGSLPLYVTQCCPTSRLA